MQASFCCRHLDRGAGPSTSETMPSSTFILKRNHLSIEIVQTSTREDQSAFALTQSDETPCENAPERSAVQHLFPLAARRRQTALHRVDAVADRRRSGESRLDEYCLVISTGYEFVCGRKYPYAIVV